MYKKLLIAFCATAIASHAAAQKYEDIYYGLPNMTLDQAYTELMDFQKANPYFPNTYLQLGIICEQKMVHFDPLRDCESAQFWAQNANLFFSNFKVFYKEGDLRSNSEYYENLRIPFNGKKMQESDLWSYVDKHAAVCKNFQDSTLLVYNAIEKSKSHYNRCLIAYKEICDKYANINEALLQNDAALDAKLKQIGRDIDDCIASFNEYKRLTSLYPIMNYKQFYELKPIETFRLDGLTNSDFYSNRFNIWDYRRWLNDYEKTLQTDILPLRKRISDINAHYLQARKEFDVNGGYSKALQRPYDERFIFSLGKYDNSSVVRELFAYHEAVRKLVAMSADSLAQDAFSSPTLDGPRLRHLYRMTGQLSAADEARSKLASSVTPERVVRFKDFFTSSYGGEAGLRKFTSSDGEFCRAVFQRVVEAYASYADSLAAFRKRVDVYSAKSAKFPALPLWPVQDDKILAGQYATSTLAYGPRGNVCYLAGHRKGKTSQWFVAKIADDGATEWIPDLKGVSSVFSIAPGRSSCVVDSVRHSVPTAIVVDGAGKESKFATLPTENLSFLKYSEMSGIMFYSPYGSNSVAMVDSLGSKMWEVSVPSFSSLSDAAIVGGDALLVVGQSTDGLAVSLLSANGEVSNTLALGKSTKSLVRLYRASAHEFCLVVSYADGTHGFVILTEKGERIF